MNPFLKTGCLLLAAGILTTGGTPRKTTGDFMMESYSSQMKRHLAEQQTAAEHRAGEYSSMYQTCRPDHDCLNATASGRARLEAQEAAREFPFMSARFWQ